MDKDRNYVNMQVNPCKMCMPMGAALALRGIQKSMTIIHGSQGCSTYIRRHILGHYNEPIDIASSSLSEEGTVYGGAKNLKIGIKNMVDMYQPEVVGVLTTCLAETIGDDIERIVKEVRDTGEFEGCDIIPIPTPGYGASQSEGYFKGLRAILEYYGKDVEQKEQGNHINIVVSNATCEDIRYLKDLFRRLGVQAIIYPDISDVLDAPYKTNYNKLSEDGTSRAQILDMFRARATIELGDLVAGHYSPALYLEASFSVPAFRMPLPIGMVNTDLFIETICQICGISMPKDIEKERGRLLDGMIDAHKHSALGRVAVFGDMDLVYGVSRLLAENGVKVKVAAIGAENKRFKIRLTGMLEEFGQESIVLQDSDFETIRAVIAKENVNLMIGHSDGKFIWEKDGIDLIRIGFPVHDHLGAQRILYFGYKGSIQFLDRIVNTLLDQKHRTYKEWMLNTYYNKEVV